MTQKVGIVAPTVVDAAGLGARFARQGCAVRLFTPQADLEELPAHLFTQRTDVAVVVAESSGGREAQAAAALERWGPTFPVEHAPEAMAPPEPFDPLSGQEISGSGGTLVLTGSFMPQARAQVERLADEGALVLTLTREAVLNNDETYLLALSSGAAAAIKQGRNVIVRSENWPEAAIMTRKLAAKRLIPVDEIERRITSMLARVGEAVMKGTSSRKLIAVGTDTSEALCRQLAITEMVLVKEAAPGVPAMLAPGPAPLLLVLKSGSSGEPDALVQAVKCLTTVQQNGTAQG